MGAGKRRRDEVVRRMMRLADQSSNDSVRLAFMDENEAEAIREMDLSALVGMKRSKDGAVEVKLIDRVEILEKLYQMLRDEGDDGMAKLLTAMGKTEKEA